MSCQFLSYHAEKRIGFIEITDLKIDPLRFIGLSCELKTLCTEIGLNKGVRVVLLAGVGNKAFSMRQSLKGIGNGLGETFCEPIAKLNLPVFAVINGDAIGEGLELALACDIRIASETSHFGFPQVKSGLIPWDGGTQRLSRLVGKGKALEMILTGELFDAQEAFRIGLVNKVVSPDKVMTVAMDIAEEIATKGPIALRYAKEAIYKGMDMTLEQGLHLEADLYCLLHSTRDRIEGIKAFQEKRSPHFRGE